MGTSKIYTREELEAKELNVLDAIAEECGVDSFEQFGTDTPDKEVLINAIIEAQEQN